MFPGWMVKGNGLFAVIRNVFLYADGLFYHSQSTDDSLTGFKVVPHLSTVLFVVQTDN